MHIKLRDENDNIMLDEASMAAIVVVSDGRHVNTMMELSLPLTGLCASYCAQKECLQEIINNIKEDIGDCLPEKKQKFEKLLGDLLELEI